MSRLFHPDAYRAGPVPGGWLPGKPPLAALPSSCGTGKADVAVIGGGFTGLNAALDLAASGRDVALLEAATPGWGASGRNGGFCCIGGDILGPGQLRRLVGEGEAARYEAFRAGAIGLVAERLAEFGIDAAVSGAGEVCLAHSARAARAMAAAPWPGTRFVGRDGLADLGMAGSGFFGGLTRPEGFGLDPLAYLHGLVRAAIARGVRLFGESPVTGLAPAGGGWRVETARGVLHAAQVLVATNGYSSDALPAWLAGRYLPAFSSVLLTRPLTPDEQRAQGWTSPIMAYDSRRLLHYFRLLPDGRFLFGMRGGLSGRDRAQARAGARLARDFARLFPVWAGVEVESSWSGLVCLTGAGHPYGGPVPGAEGLFAAFGYHGNGVAMASATGRAMAALMSGDTDALPALMHRLPPRIRPGRLRLGLLALAYGAAMLGDRFGSGKV